MRLPHSVLKKASESSTSEGGGGFCEKSVLEFGKFLKCHFDLRQPDFQENWNLLVQSFLSGEFHLDRSEFEQIGFLMLPCQIASADQEQVVLSSTWEQINQPPEEKVQVYQRQLDVLKEENLQLKEENLQLKEEYRKQKQCQDAMVEEFNQKGLEQQTQRKLREETMMKLHHEVEMMKKAMVQSKGTIQALLAKNNQVEETNSQVKDQNMQFRLEVRRLQAFNDKATALSNTLTEKNNELETGRLRQKEEIALLKEQIKGFEEEVSQEKNTRMDSNIIMSAARLVKKQELEDYQKKRKEDKAVIDLLNQQNEYLKKEISKLQLVDTTTSTIKKTFRMEFELVKKENNRLNEQINRMRQTQASGGIPTNSSECLLKIASLKEQNSRLKIQMNRMRSSGQTSSGKHPNSLECLSEVASLKQQISVLKVQLTQMRANAQESTETLVNSSESEIATLKEQNSRLKVQINRMRASQKGKTHREVNTAKSANVIHPGSISELSPRLRRPLNTSEKEKLSIGINKLPLAKMLKVIQIIADREPLSGILGPNEEIHVDMDLFDPSTLWILFDFIYPNMKTDDVNSISGMSLKRKRNNRILMEHVIGNDEEPSDIDEETRKRLSWVRAQLETIERNHRLSDRGLQVINCELNSSHSHHKSDDNGTTTHVVVAEDENINPLVSTDENTTSTFSETDHTVPVVAKGTSTVRTVDIDNVTTVDGKDVNTNGIQKHKQRKCSKSLTCVQTEEERKEQIRLQELEEQNRFVAERKKVNAATLKVLEKEKKQTKIQLIELAAKKSLLFRFFTL